MRHSLLCLILMSGCALPQSATTHAHHTKIPDSPSGGQRHKSREGDGTTGIDLDIGPSNQTMMLIGLVIGGVVLAFALSGDDEPPAAPVAEDVAIERPRWLLASTPR